MIKWLLKQRPLRHLEILPCILCVILGVGTVFSLCFVYANGAATLETASQGEQAAMSVEQEPGARFYLAEVPTVLVTADGVEFAGDTTIDAASYNLIGRPAGRVTRWLADVWQNETLAEEIYSPMTGLWVKKRPENQRIELTLRDELQTGLYECFQELGKTGTAYVYNYETGSVLGCVSTPGCSSQDPIENLPEGALLNKNLYTVPPGSTMKIQTLLLLAEQTDLANLSYTCSGAVTFDDGTTIDCHHAHGEVTCEEAIGLSCNSFFAQAVVEHLDPKKVAERLREMGWNVNETGRTMVAVSSISINDSTIELNETWDFTSIWSMLGETEVTVSPVHLTTLAASYVIDSPAMPRFRLDEEVMYDTRFEPGSEAKKMWRMGFEEWMQPRFDESLSLGKTGLYEFDDGTVTATFLGVHEESSTAFFISVEDDEDGHARDQLVNRTVQLLNEQMDQKEEQQR